MDQFSGKLHSIADGTAPRPVYLYAHTFSLRFHYQYVPGFDVFRFIDRAVADGFAGVSLSANGPGYRHLGAAEWFARVRDRLAADNLLCDVDTSGTAPDHLETMLDVAARVGAQQLRTYTWHRRNRQEMVELTTRDLIAAAPLAAARRIRILLENHEEFTGAEIARVLAAVDSPWIGALYDYGNSMMVMEEPLQALQAMAPYARAAHLKDHVMLQGADSPDGQLSVLGVPIGQGHLPIAETTRRLCAAGLDRITFENVWAYRAPVDASRIDGDSRRSLGSGTFAYVHPPFEAPRCLPDLGTLEGDPQRLVELEDRAMRDGLRWFRQLLRQEGIEEVRNRA